MVGEETEILVTLRRPIKCKMAKRTRVAKINFLFLVQSIIHLALHAECNRNDNLLLFLLFQ